MTKIKDGGPAFPLQSIGPEFAHGYAGMTLRDYFAIRAFQTRLAKYNDWTLKEITDQAWRDADVMLRARGTP